MHGMRSLVLLSVFVLLGCPATEGPPGRLGPQGEVGPSGSTGAMGAPGPAGPQGDAGPAGPMGAPGTDGPPGPQGIQGAPGMVLVLDGGVVTGPAGASVVVSPIAPGATCSGGGLRVTQLSDGGISSVCNGAPGVTGPAGTMGATGAAGPPGAPLTATALPLLSPQCPTGGVLVVLADGGALAVCNGATGPTGMTGTTGAAGGPGPAGATGSAGPPGPALFLDGGLAFLNDTPSFAGFTTTTYNGSIGGDLGANAKCNAEFSGSVLCTLSDFDRANPVALPPASGAWIDSIRQASGQRTQDSCSSGGVSWNLATAGDTGTNLTPFGVAGPQVVCNLIKPLACCRAPTAFIFRGYTTATFNGAIGGHIGANAKCAAEFPGSSFCTVAEFEKANPLTTPPASGSWIDTNRGPTGMRTQNSCSSAGVSWTLNTVADTGTNLNALGLVTAQVVCNQVKPLACCQLR